MYEVKLKKSIWVIGDVHGDINKLKILLNKIYKEDPEPNICFVGDLIDRGEFSSDVVELVKENYFCVLGNHEVVMIHPDNVKDSNYRIGWFGIGGEETYSSYYDKKNLLKSHIAWIKNLPLIIKFVIKNEKPLFVSHSGFDIDNLDSIDSEFVLWNKKSKYPVSETAINIFGHKITPIQKSILSKSHICIDSGGYKDFNKDKGIGFLTAINYPSLKTIYSYDEVIN